jgi:phosphohistidine phosphatase
MHRLILFRHAKAERRAPSGDDYDRDLTDRGAADADIMGRVLAQKGYIPDLALVSGAVRTRSTWAAMAAHFPAARMEVDEDLFNAPAVDLLAAARHANESGCVLVVAHNPGLHEAATYLMARSEARHREIDAVRAGMPTATAAVFDMSGDKPHLEAWLLARDFGGGAGE